MFTPDPAWAKARTLSDLAELTAQWLEGRLPNQPSYPRPVDVDEHAAPGLTAALIACNRGGLLTVTSQAAVQTHEGHQLAAVAGFADEDVAARIADAVGRDGQFWISGHEQLSHNENGPAIYGFPLPVTWHRGNVVTHFGGELEDDEVQEMFPTCDEELVLLDVATSYYLAIVDPVPGSNALWPFLESVHTLSRLPEGGPR